MGKNYTLYIKYDEFDSVDNKSGLVNSLLDKHFVKGAAEAIKSFPQHANRSADLKPKANQFDRDIQFCKHGNVKGTCKLGCK